MQIRYHQHSPTPPPASPGRHSLTSCPGAQCPTQGLHKYSQICLLFHSVESQDKDYFHWKVPTKHWLLRIWFYPPTIQWKCLSYRCSFFCHRAREPWALLSFLMWPREGRAWPLMTIALPTSNFSPAILPQNLFHFLREFPSELLYSLLYSSSIILYSIYIYYIFIIH